MTRTHRRLTPFFVVLALALGRDARAAWPPPPDATREQLADPANWPNDPDYGGQWQHWSWIPREAQMLPGFRAAEIETGAGNRTDAAWALTAGDPRVLIAVLDSGIHWDNENLQLQAALNTGELPVPLGAVSHDANGDGVVDVSDWARDPRVPCGTTLPHPLRDCRGADGAPNDPNGNGVLDAGDLIRVFSNGLDEDANGYVDDISGWDFFKDDNDPYDDTRYGHGTSEAVWSAARGDDGVGRIGACPRCQFVPLRVGDSFITDANDFAQATVYAADADYGGGRRVRVVQEALGTLNNTAYAMAAIDYAYARGAVVIASAADENSRHHNMPGTNNHTVYVHAVRYNGRSPQTSTSFLAFNNCTNYGAQLQLSVAGTACSSEATGQAAGLAGLIYSMAEARSLAPALSAEEARQLLVQTTDDIAIAESQPGHPLHDPRLYPSLPGWDQRFGYGRTNARRAVEWVRDGRIPPEVDITAPRWFTVLYPDRVPGGRLRLEGHIAARRAPSFDYVVEWARGVEPAPDAWQTLRAERNVTAPLADVLAELDLASLAVDNPGEVENRFAITVRVRAVAHYDAPVGDVPGEARRAFYVHRDPDLLPGFPVDTVSSGEASAHLADLNRDGRSEIVVATADGRVHAYQADGTELPGFPVHTDPDLGFDPRRLGRVNYTNAPAYRRPTPAIDPRTLYETVLATPGVADLDGDGDLEVVVAGYHGTVYVWNHDGTPYGHGFPVSLPDVPSEQTSPTRILDRGIFGAPVLVDLDRDGVREVVVGAFDGHVYAFRGRDAAVQPGFPVLIHNPRSAEYNRVFGAVGVGNFDGDAVPDLVVVSNERQMGDPHTGAIYLVHGDGNAHPGGAYHPNWPLVFKSFNLFPLVGEGISSSPAIADVDGDGRDELSLTGTGQGAVLIGRGVQPPHAPDATPDRYAYLAFTAAERRGPLSDSRSNPVSFINAFSLGAFGDMTGDGVPEFVLGGATVSLALNLTGTNRSPYEHLLGAWDARTGAPLPGFPRVVEDYMFFQNPAIADVSGDGYAEAIVGTGGYYVHAFDACGREAPEFPKFTGQWVVPSPAVGDLDGDGALDLALGTRSGYLYAWRTRGDARTGSVQWASFRHDGANTGNLGTPLEVGVRRPAGVGPIRCPLPSRPDGGAGDGAADDAGDVVRVGGGCGCRTVGNTTTGAAPAATVLAALAALAALGRRRPRATTHRRRRATTHRRRRATTRWTGCDRP